MRVVVLTGIIAALAAGPAFAAPSECTNLGGTISTEPAPTDCQSPFGVCLTGTATLGGLDATTYFTATSVEQSGAVLRFAGTLVVTTSDGTLVSEQRGVVNLVTGQTSETGLIVEGTGAFEGARGVLTFTGTQTGAGGFAGRANGALCTPR